MSKNDDEDDWGDDPNEASGEPTEEINQHIWAIWEEHFNRENRIFDEIDSIVQAVSLLLGHALELNDEAIRQASESSLALLALARTAIDEDTDTIRRRCEMRTIVKALAEGRKGKTVRFRSLR